MANSWTTEDLISDIELLSHIPTDQQTFTETKILRLATLELQTPIMKQILSTRGGYYLTYEDCVVNSTGLYPIPSGAVAGALANVELVQSTTIIQVNLIEESEQFSTNAPTSTGYGFFMRGNFVQILPSPPVGTPRLWYTKRTSDLILTSAAMQVVSIAGAAITVNAVPSTFSVGSSVDCCGDQPPFNIFETREITDITGVVVTLDEAVADMSIGDWIALEGQTPIPQIPVEYRLPLAQRVVCKYYETQGYFEKLGKAKEVLKEYEQNAMNMVTPRVKSQSRIINAINGGFMGNSSNRYFNYPASRE